MTWRIGVTGSVARAERFAIRSMGPDDLDFAAGCTQAEGWGSETRPEFEGFLAHDANGCLVAEGGGERAGICVATSYGEVGYVGMLIVRPAMRGRGLGRALLQHAVEYLQRRGARNVYLDGVEAAVPLYERAGFRKLCRSLRFSGSIQGRRFPQVRAMKAADLGAVCALDREGFGADRRFFLERRFSRYPELCWVLEAGQGIQGFVMGRRVQDVVSAGPWVVRRGSAHPEDLLEHLAAGAHAGGLALGVLEANAAAVQMIRSGPFTERADAPWRMVLGTGDLPGHPELCYAIGTAAKG